MCFSRFNTSKLLWNHVFNLCINSFTSFPNFRFSGFETIRLVSSANKIGVDKLDIAYGKSLIYNKKKRGPKIEPFRTPSVQV